MPNNPASVDLGSLNKSLNLLDNHQQATRELKHQKLYGICASIIGVVVIAWAGVSTYVYTLNQKQIQIENTTTQKIAELKQREVAWNTVNEYDQTLKALRTTKHDKQDLPHIFWNQLQEIAQSTNITVPKFTITNGVFESTFNAENKDDQYRFVQTIGKTYNDTVWDEVRLTQAGRKGDIYTNVVEAELIQQ